MLFYFSQNYHISKMFSIDVTLLNAVKAYVVKIANVQVN